MSDPANDGAQSPADTATSAAVGALTSMLGLRGIGFPVGTVIHAILYFIVTMVITLASASIVKFFAPQFPLSGTPRRILESLATAFVSLLIVLALQVFGLTDSVSGAGSGSGGSTTSRSKAAQPPNTEVCDRGTNDSFTSVAADLGKRGLGAAGVGDGTHYTSCGFALNVRAAYVHSYSPGTAGTVSTTSPAAPELGTIYMSCSSAASNLIRCDGGQDAHVYIY